MWRLGGGGSSNLDINNNDIADVAESINDGLGNSATALEIKDAIVKKHASGSDNQDLSGLALKTTKVNGHELSSDVAVTKSDVGLPNVDNKSEATIILDTKADSDVADALSKKHAHGNQAQLDAVTDGDHDVRTDNPHSVTKTQVGLGNVDNKSEATIISDVKADADIKETIDRLQTGEASSDSVSSTTSVTYINKLTLNFTPNTSGNYLIAWSAELANSSEKNSTYCRVQQGGANIAGDVIARSGGIVGVYLPCSGIKVSALVALTAYSFTMDYCAELTTAYIRNARLVIKKI